MAVKVLIPGQGQDGTVQFGKDLAQMRKLFQMDLKGHIPAGPLQSNPFDPSNEPSRPMAHLLVLWNHYPVKEKHGLNLVLAPGLFPTHAQPSPNQTAILQRGPRRNIDSFQLVIAKTPGQLPAIHLISPPPSLFVPGRHIRRVYNDTVNRLLYQLGVDPKTTTPCFINRMIEGTRKMMSQVVRQGCRLRRLAEAFVFPMARVDAHLPGLLVDIQTDVNRLTRKIKFVTIKVIHGKSPFGWILCRNKIIPENQRLAFSFLNPF
jgi:hypothetical protein